MDTNLQEVKNFKIVPENYKSSTFFDIKEIKDGKIFIFMPKISEDELKDYNEGATVSAFGLAQDGIVYFETKIMKREGKELVLNYPYTTNVIQRRKYTRVPFDGKITLLSKNAADIKAKDLSAGGLKFLSDTPFNPCKEYKIRIELINSIVIDCTIECIRTEENSADDKYKYTISAKITQIRSIDRIALMQYSFRVKTELENKNKNGRN